MMHRSSKFTLVILLTSIMVSGCVTERTYSGTNTPVAEKKIDKIAAARQRVQLGLSYLKKGNGEQAKYNLDKALSFAPNLEAVHLGLAYYYKSVGEMDKAEKSYINAVNADDATGDSKNNFGVFLCQEKKYDQAEKMFLEAINTPNYIRSAASYENLGLCSIKEGDPKKAKKYFETALKYDTHRRTSQLELIKISIGKNNYSQAKLDLARFHRTNTQSAQSLALGVKIEQGLNSDDGAKKFGILLLSKFPTSNEAKQYRATMY